MDKANTSIISIYAIPGLEQEYKKFPTVKINPMTIVDDVLKLYDVTLDDVKKKSRKRKVVLPRQVCMTFLKMHTDWTYNHIGEFFGGRDHTTVIHAIQTIKDLTDVDQDFRSKLEGLYPLKWYQEKVLQITK